MWIIRLIKRYVCLWLLLLLFTFIPEAWAETVYQWVDDQGVTHFSDQPHAGAKEMALPMPQSMSPSSTKRENSLSSENNTSTSNTPSAATSPAKTDKNKTTELPQFTITITQPQNEQNLATGDSADVGVSVTIKPDLPTNVKDLSVSILLDGSEIASGNKTQFSLGWLDRGQHSLQAVIKQNNKTIAQSSSITFYVQHPTLNSPARKHALMNFKPSRFHVRTISA